MGEKKIVDYSAEVIDFVDTYDIVSCRLDGTIYHYDASAGIYVPADDVQFSKLASDFLNFHSTELHWNDTNMRLLMRYARTMAPYYRRMGEKKVLVLNNGTFHLKDMRLHAHSPKNRAIAKLDFDYDPDANCPVTDAFLKTMADGNENVYLTLWQLLGYVAMRSKRARKAFIIASSGGSGKSQYLRLLSEFACKAYTTYLSIESINDTRKSFDRLPLLNSHLNITQELSKKDGDLNTFFSENVKKAVTLEEIDAEFKFGEKVYFVPDFILVVASNFTPSFSSMPSESILRRIVFINITKVLSYQEQDPDLFVKIKKELSGVFNKAIEAYRILKNNKFVFAVEEESRALLKAKVNERYPMYSFVKDKIEICPGNRVYYSDLQDAYRSWAEEKDIFATLDSKSLSKELKNAIDAQHIPVESGKSNGNRYLSGIKIL